MRIVVILGLLCTFGCASFQNRPGQIVSLPTTESVYGTGHTVSVRMMDGTWRPWCGLPDASNMINCTFYYGWFENGMISEPNGYRYLTPMTARKACAAAMWSAHGTPGEVEACKRALMVQRWMVDPEIFDEPEVIYSEPKE